MARTPAQMDENDALRDELDDLKAQVNALLQQKTQSGGLSPEALESMLVRVAQISADAQERAANPSNRTHLGKGPYSYPEGDVARPRKMKCQMFQCGYDMELDTTSAVEIELMNQATPGVYSFTRLDGTQERLTITAEQTPGGEITKLFFDFNARDRRDSLPSWPVILRDALKIKTPEQQELEALRALLAEKQTVAA